MADSWTDLWIHSDELLDRLAHISVLVEEAQEWVRSDSYGSVYEKVEELENHIQHLKAMWEDGDGCRIDTRAATVCKASVF